ncbi:MAG: P1 family peptidase [Cyclobacteriaceae bacterium]|nr:P1 family peptidase [Cyclobacteriaceae bacterium]
MLRILICALIALSITQLQAQNRAREHGLDLGVLPTGTYNAITDVPGVQVGHYTMVLGDSVRTGLTAIKPHQGNIFQDKVPAGIFVGNGFGKLAGSTQVKELGNLETPIVLTNTLNVGLMVDALVQYTLALPGNESIRSVNALVGETNDGWLNQIRYPALRAEHLLEALESATGGKVTEGNVGAGTGTICFGFKGGMGTSSRTVPASSGGYTVGVLVQSNFGGVLTIDGAPLGKILKKHYLANKLYDQEDGSCMIVVATDAPLDARNLQRLAQRAMLGLGRTGGIASNGSGDYVIAFTTHPDLRIAYDSRDLRHIPVLPNNALSPLFLATIEATEEAIINSLFAAETMTGFKGRTVESLPLEQVLPLLKRYGVIQD